MKRAFSGQGSVNSSLSLVFLLASATCSVCWSDSITSVSPISTQQVQNITISGTGFGTHSSYSGDSSYISFSDVNRNWEAGFTGACPAAFNGCDGVTFIDDALGLVVDSWSDSSVMLGGFSGPWGSSGFGCSPACDLAAGDQVVIFIWNPQTGTEAGSITATVGGVASVPEPSSLALLLGVSALFLAARFRQKRKARSN